jgi:hypothetical protein
MKQSASALLVYEIMIEIKTFERQIASASEEPQVTSLRCLQAGKNASQ